MLLVGAGRDAWAMAEAGRRHRHDRERHRRTAARPPSTTPVPALVDLGRALRRVLRQNAALSAIYNAVVIPAAALGHVPPLAAAGLVLLETLFGLASAARLLRR